MKCELCHKADAKVAIHKVIDGKSRELYVCEKCAGKPEEPPEKENSVFPEGALPEGVDIKVSGPLPLPPDFLSDIFGKLIGDMEAKSLSKNPTAATFGKPCPACGMTPLQFQREGRLGCPECYKNFFKIVAPMIREMHKGTTHAGKIPESAKKTRSGKDSK